MKKSLMPPGFSEASKIERMAMARKGQVIVSFKKSKPKTKKTTITTPK
jgi:hypothetical protein